MKLSKMRGSFPSFALMVATIPLSRLIVTSGSAQPLTVADRERVLLMIDQDGTGTDKARLGNKDITATVGRPFLSGERIILRGDEAGDAEWWAIAQTGTPTVVVTEAFVRRVG